MVPKITTGSSIRSSLEYDLASKNGEPGGEWIAGSLSGSAREMAKSAALFRQLRPDCKKAIWSVSLSLPPADGRQSAEKWAEITHSFLKKMGIDHTKYAWAAHRHDFKNDHIHIRLCRISADGALWNQEYSARRAIKACSELESEFELNKHSRTPAPKSRPSRAEIEISQRKGTPMSREKIQESVNKIIAEHPEGIDFQAFAGLLQAENIEVLLYAPGGILKGVSYSFDSLKWPGSKIGREYSVGLPERGVRYGSEAKIQAEKATVERAENDRARANDRAPAMVRNILKPRPKVDLDLDLAKTTNSIVRSDIGPVSKVMLLVGMAALRLSAAALEALLNFVRWLLKKLGFALQPAAPGSAQAATKLPFSPSFIDVESRFLPKPKPESAIENRAEEAAHELLKVVDSLEKNDPDLLPPGQGREELVAALVAEQSPFSFLPADDKTVDIQAPQEIKQDGLDLDELFPAPKTEFFRQLNGLIDDAMAALDRAVKAQQDAESAVNDAPKLEADEVIEAKLKLILAEQKLAARENEHYFQKAEAPKLLRFAFPSVESFSAKEIAAVDAAKAVLAGVQKAHPAEVPEHLNVAPLQARLGSIRAAEVALNEQKKLLVSMKEADVELFNVAKKRVDFFASQVKTLGHHPSTFNAQLALKSGEDAIISIAKKRIEIEETARREVQKALEASSQTLVPRNECGDDDAPGR